MDTRPMHDRLRQEAHLWLKPLDESGHSPPLDALSADERRRLETIRHPRALHHFVAGRALVRQVLSQYAPVEPREWLFEKTASGRPEIAAPDTDSRLRFNLSHTDGLVACLVTESIDCGVDVENLDRRVDILGIASHSFTEAERAALERLPDPERTARFFDLWTLKEAYLKACGSGLRLRLDVARFGVTSGGLIDHRISGVDFDNKSEWRFALFRPDPEHLLAAAIRSGTSAHHEFRCWELDNQSRARRLNLPAVAATALG